jgi:hypothetical protein
VPYFNRDRLLKSSEHFDLLIEQGKIDEIAKHVEGLLKDGNLNGATWIVKMLADAGKADAFDRLCEQVKEAFQVDASRDSKTDKALWEYRGFLTQSALSAYFEGQRDLCYATFMKLEPIWMNTSMGERVAYKALENGDMEFLRRMESSQLPMMRAPALETLAVHRIRNGDIDAARMTAETYDREFGKNVTSSIYRTITDDRLVKDPARLLAATQLAVQQVPFDSKDYHAIAVKRAKLLGQTNPDQPLPAEWLKKLDQNPKLKYEVELAHANGCWEK